MITAIVSTYAAERFIRGCLEDLVGQTFVDRMEILVIDSGSPEGEGRICEEFARIHPQVRYVRTEREPPYAAWNRAIGMAKGKYLTTANTDDRHRPDFMQAMVAMLEANPDVALAYGDKWISNRENETFAECVARGAEIWRRAPEYSRSALLMSCFPSAQPVWRKALHAEFGLFDTRYSIVADHDMWLRFASKYSFRKLPGVWGVLFESGGTLSGTDNRMPLNFEVLALLSRYVRTSPWRELPGIRKRVASDLFRRGYQHVEKDGDSRAGLPFFLEAIRLYPLDVRFVKTYVVRSLVSLFGPRKLTTRARP